MLFSAPFGVKWSQRTSCSLHESLWSHRTSHLLGGTAPGISQTSVHRKRGTICHENNGVMSALAVTSPPTSLACAVPSPTAAITMCWKDPFSRLGAGTGRRKTRRGRRACCWCKRSGRAISCILTSTPCCSVTRHFDEVIFHCRADACTIQRQILTSELLESVIMVSLK